MNDKRYLIITPWCPYPPHKNGGVHTIYNILQNIPSNIEMDLLYYSEKDDKAEKEVRNLTRRIFFKSLQGRYALFNRACCFAKGIPDYLSRYDLQPLTDTVNFNNYDVVILDQVFSLPIVEQIPTGIRIIAMMHDNNAMLYKRMAVQDGSLLKKYYDEKQVIFFQKLEERFYSKVERVIYVSDKDAELAKAIHPNLNCEFTSISLGVEIPSDERISHCNNPTSFVFSGVMDYGPNEDAAIYFATYVFPKIFDIYPESTFTIAGKNVTDRIQQLQNKHIFVTGYVNDMISTITKSALYISPLRYGSGTKNKVLEAMAARMPVVATPVSREGINGLIDGENCVFTDIENMAEKIIGLIGDKEKMFSIASAGRQYVEDNHSWRHVFDSFLL